MPPTLHTESLQTNLRSEMIDITDRIQKLVTASNIPEGMAIIFVPHTTAAITINENADPDVKRDLLRKLESLIPHRESYYQHGEGNSDSHLKTSLTGNSVLVLIENRRLVLGTWQGIQFCEFDGPRQRRFQVKITPLA